MNIQDQLNDTVSIDDNKPYLLVITVDFSDHTPAQFIKSISCDFVNPAVIEVTDNLKEAQRFSKDYSVMLYHYLSSISECKHHSHYPIQNI